MVTGIVVGFVLTNISIWAVGLILWCQADGFFWGSAKGDRK